jgi:hypothetical protein
MSPNLNIIKPKKADDLYSHGGDAASLESAQHEANLDAVRNYDKYTEVDASNYNDMNVVADAALMVNNPEEWLKFNEAFGGPGKYEKGVSKGFAAVAEGIGDLFATAMTLGRLNPATQQQSREHKAMRNHLMQTMLAQQNIKNASDFDLIPIRKELERQQVVALAQDNKKEALYIKKQQLTLNAISEALKENPEHINALLVQNELTKGYDVSNQTRQLDQRDTELNQKEQELTIQQQNLKFATALQSAGLVEEEYLKAFMEEDTPESRTNFAIHFGEGMRNAAEIADRSASESARQEQLNKTASVIVNFPQDKLHDVFVTPKVWSDAIRDLYQGVFPDLRSITIAVEKPRDKDAGLIDRMFGGKETLEIQLLANYDYIRTLPENTKEEKEIKKRALEEWESQESIGDMSKRLETDFKKSYNINRDANMSALGQTGGAGLYPPSSANFDAFRNLRPSN